MTSTNVHQRAAAFQRCIEQRDVTAAEDILDDDYSLVLVHPASAVIPKARWIAMLPDYVVHSYDVLENVTDIDGERATIFHRARQRATVMGVDRSGLFVITDIWRVRGDRWRLWRRHSTPLDAGEMPAR
jgi:hypothetical protein